YALHRAEWRPFQLGFLLLTIEGASTDCDDRDVVDLIWFPTGGGKTEAYLALAAFSILIRRIRYGDDAAGTTVITRYTLRLLTSDQFRRAATLVCALELLRRDRADDLGSTEISIGLWVGSANSPNTYAEAQTLVKDLRSGQPIEKGFQIEKCPWCGTRLLPDEGSAGNIGFQAHNNSFQVFCLNRGCPFFDRIPMASVDEQLYDRPPTVLIGTVDKFATAVWNERTGVFFGAGDDPGPSLIIQDEFHLISGPLGTIVGLYEAAFDVLMERHGARPKIVASTATIRRADEQTLGVFGRDVALFPPAGLDADDSYFVRVDHDKPGRAYVGLMPQGHTPVTGLVHLSAALLQASIDVE
nr:helicase [Micromonospora sp. DSM 115978]